MLQKDKENIALLRYGAISALLSGVPEGYSSRTAYFRAAAARGIAMPDGKVRYYSPKTLDQWYRDYKVGGFDALFPKDRADVGKTRKLDEYLREMIRHMKKAYPKMPATAIHKQLKDNGTIRHGEISVATVNRFVKQVELAEKEGLPEKQVRRYERPHVNEVWCGDTCVGPYLRGKDGKRRKVYVIALIDDASRFVVGIDVFYQDNFVNLMSVLKSAVSKYGRPVLLNFDNGASYKNQQMQLLAARIGTAVHYDHPYSPAEKAKIERWYLTLRMQYFSGLDMNRFSSLDELRKDIREYVCRYNTTVHSSLNGKSPQERYFLEEEKNCFQRLGEEEIEKSFLLEIERRVSADGVISIDNSEYEVDTRFSKKKIRLRYTPDREKIYAVEADGSLAPIRVLNKVENALAKREKVYLTGGAE